jgi:hypothetical protein
VAQRLLNPPSPLAQLARPARPQQLHPSPTSLPLSRRQYGGVGRRPTPLALPARAQMGTPIPTVAGGGNLALDSRSSMVLQEEAGEDGGPKTQAPASAGLGRQISGVASSKFLQTDKYG